MMQENLKPFSILQQNEVINPIDFEFCRFLTEIAPGISENILSAACLTSMAYQNGDICIALDEYAGQNIFEEAPQHEQVNTPSCKEWITELKESPVVGTPGDFKPLILDQANRLYLHKLWHYEQNLIRQITHKLDQPAPEIDAELLKNGLTRLFEEYEGTDWQKIAVIAALQNLFTVISGGPGTGKTTTVVRLIALIIEQGISRDSIPAIALAAPTGKAAARLETSIRDSKQQLPVDEDVKAAIPVEAVTIHQLLGARRHTAGFRYNEDNPLPYDCVIIDEVSMVDQALMSRLLDALLVKTRLVLLGDKDQLASVEAGSILGDICGEEDGNILSERMAEHVQKYNVEIPANTRTDDPLPLMDHIVLLQKSYRFDEESGIGQLAKAVNSGDSDKVMQLIGSDDFKDISLLNFDDYKSFEGKLFKRIEVQFKRIQSAQTVREKLSAYQTFKVLAAHRKGPWGADQLNRRMEQRLQQSGKISPYDQWYDGRPVIINTNDYTVGLSNGDIGICMINERGEPMISFAAEDKFIELSPSRLPAHSTAFVMTVHKSQGSEFGEVFFVMPDKPSKILSRELVYTAITRAREKVTIFGNKHVIETAIHTQIARNSGLKDYFWN